MPLSKCYDDGPMCPRGHPMCPGGTSRVRPVAQVVERWTPSIHRGVPLVRIWVGDASALDRDLWLLVGDSGQLTSVGGADRVPLMAMNVV